MLTRMISKAAGSGKFFITVVAFVILNARMKIQVIFVSSSFIGKFSTTLVTIDNIGTFQTADLGMKSFFVLVKVICCAEAFIAMFAFQLDSRMPGQVI